MSSGGLGMKIRAGGAFVTLGVNDKLSLGLSMAERKLQAFSQRAAALGTKLGTMSLAMLAPAAASQKVFANFETSMMKVKAILTPTGQEFTAMWQQAKKLGETTQFTASDAARAMATFAQANFTTQQIMSAMPATLDLAAAGEMDVAEAADIAATIMNAMGIKAEGLVTTVDVLTKASQTASTDLRQLGHAFQYAGAIAATAGLSLEESVVFLQMMSNASIKADMAGTTLRGALLALASPSQMAKERLQELGIDVSTVKGDFASLSEIIKQFNKQMGHLGSQEQMAFLGDIFDSRQAAGFAKAVANGHELFVKMEKSLYNSTGAAQKFAKTMMSGVTGSWLYFTSAVEGLQITIGEIGASYFQGLLKGLTDTTAELIRFISQNEELVPKVLIAGSAIGGLGLSLLALSYGITTVTTLIAPLTFALTTLSGIVFGLAGLLPTLVNPLIGLPVIAAGLTIATSNFSVDLNNMKVAVDHWSAWMKWTFSNTFAGLQDAIKSGNLKLAFDILLTGIKLAFATTLNAIAEMFQTSVLDMVRGSFNEIKRLMESLTKARMVYNRADELFRISQPWATDEDKAMAAANTDRMTRQYLFWKNFNPDGIAKDIAKSLDTGMIARELEDLNSQAREQAIKAEKERNTVPSLGPPREMPAPRVPDMPNMPKIEEAKKEIDRAIAFAAVGSLGGRLLDRMGAGPKSVTDKIAENTKKMLQEQQETNQILGDMDGLTFAP